VLQLRGSERAIRKPDRFVSCLHQIDSYQNLLEDWTIQFTSFGIRGRAQFKGVRTMRTSLDRVVYGLIPRPTSPLWSTVRSRGPGQNGDS
jgi:hypothetical protein